MLRLPRAAAAILVLLLAGAAPAAEDAAPSSAKGGPRGEDDGTRLARLTQRLESAPEDTKALLARADLYRKRGEFEAALLDLDRAAALVPNNPPELLARGRLFLAWDRPEDAVPPLQTLVSRDRQSVAGRTMLARALCAEGRKLESGGKGAEARKAWEQGLWHLERLPLYLRSTATVKDLEAQAREALVRLAS